MAQSGAIGGDGSRERSGASAVFQAVAPVDSVLGARREFRAAGIRKKRRRRGEERREHLINAADNGSGLAPRGAGSVLLQNRGGAGCRLLV